MTTEAEKGDQISDINTQTTRLQTYWAKRDEVLREDRDIINLIRPEAKTGESQWTSNEPKVFFDTSRSLLSINEPRFRLPITMNHPAEEKDRMNKAERLCIGIYRSINERHNMLGGTDWLWDLNYWVLLGWYAVFGIVRKNQGNVEFIADIYDPITVYPWWDAYGLAVCSRTYSVDAVAAENMVKGYEQQGLDFTYRAPPSNSQDVQIVNYWKRDFKANKPRVFNAITIGGNLIKPLTLQSKLKTIPINVGAVGSPDQTMPMWMQRKGESIVAANRDMYVYKNTILKLMAEILASTAYPNVVEKLLNNQSTTGTLKGYGEVIKLKPQESIELLKHASTPEEANYLMLDINKSSQKASIPDLTYGNIPNQEMSGFMASQLLAAVKYKLGMYLNTGQNVLSNLMRDFLYQYRTGGYKKISLSTTNPHDLRRGMFYIEDFEPADVPEHIFVEVKIPISSQFDKTQAIMNSVQALQSGLSSRETLWENLPELGVDDNEQEKARIMEDKVAQDPFIMDMEITERMWERVRFYQNRNEPGDVQRAAALKNYIMIKEMNLGIRQGIPSAPGQQGVPPQQMPPEARPTSAATPDQQNAMQGKAPPSPNRPVNPQSAGRKGVLVSPTGQPIM